MIEGIKVELIAIEYHCYMKEVVANKSDNDSQKNRHT